MFLASQFLNKRCNAITIMKTVRSKAECVRVARAWKQSCKGIYGQICKAVATLAFGLWYEPLLHALYTGIWLESAYRTGPKSNDSSASKIRKSER
ncbi:hypothetical protein Y032_0010g1013 [Ancylostoma ceylanicum]|uniref:Uncharacterized protein n=1 Tax=Ancylostoma ceylanicum TaxID=53326 RepID=A0A016VEZ2_9BILA|nr:hypothetical protein Y032_0010g1013 [Ancylostoma ceylanicum]